MSPFIKVNLTTDKLHLALTPLSNKPSQKLLTSLHHKNLYSLPLEKYVEIHKYNFQLHSTENTTLNYTLETTKATIPRDSYYKLLSC